MDGNAKLDARANAIAAFFRPYPAPEAVAGVRDHVEAFWTPAMREALRRRAEAGTAAIDPLVVEALFAPPPVARAPGRPETAGPGVAGAVGASDSG